MKRKTFGRRVVLKGFAGAAIGLPLLEVTHGEAWANGNPPPQRFVTFFDHGGTLAPTAKDGHKHDGLGEQMGEDGWCPASPDEALTLGRIHEPLLGLEAQLLVLRGIDNRVARVLAPLDGDHGWNDATALTCADAYVFGEGAESMKYAMGPSIDMVLAERLAKRNPVAFSAVHLQIEGATFGSPFYRAAEQRVEAQKSPVAAFNALFAGVTEQGAGGEPAAVRARALKKSILDGTGEMLGVFQKRLGARDRQTIDAHLEHVRALEKRVAQLAVPMVPGCQKPVIAGSFATTEEVAFAHIDVLIAALRCGLTNVGALQIGDLELLWRSPAYLDPSGSAHGMGHVGGTCGPTGLDHSKQAAWIATMLENRRWRMTLLRRFLDGLAALPEGTGTMLDHSVILWTSEFSSAFSHSACDLPILLAGGASGRVRMGRQVNYNLKAIGNPSTRDYDSKTSLHNLYTSILNAFDFGDVHFGNLLTHTMGPLSGLT